MRALLKCESRSRRYGYLRSQNNTSLPLPGEGQEEGILIKVVALILFPLPSPLGNCSMRCPSAYIRVGVPEGEGAK